MALVANATIVRVRVAPGGVDEFGDPLPSTEVRTTMPDWGVAPRSSSNVTDGGRQGVIVGLSLYTPYGADFTRTDLVEVDGELFKVDGEVGQWKSPLTSWEAGTETALRRVDG